MKKRILSLLLAALCCVALLPAALPVSAADAEAPTAADLVVKDGLLAEFRYGDSVALVTRGATWTSTDGQYTATMSGIYDDASYDIHWQKDANGAPFTLGGWAWAHSISLPDAIGAGKDTLMLETTFLAYGAQTDGEGNQVAAEQSNSWSDYSTLGACTFQLYGARFSHFNYGHKFASMSNWLCYSWSPLTEGTLGSTTWQNVYLFGTAETGVTGKADTLYLSRQYLRTEGEKDIMQVSVSTSLAGSTVENTTVPQAADNSKNAPEGAAGLITLFQGLHAKVYFIRVYDRILTDAEKAQNHFADLAALTGLDLSGFHLLNREQQERFYTDCAGIPLDCDAQTVATIREKLDTAIAAAEAENAFREALETAKTAVTSGGIDLIAEDTKAGVGSNWMIDEAVVKALVEAGFTVEIGAVMGANATTVTVTRGESAYTAADGCQFVVVYSSEENSSFVNGEAKDGVFSLDALVDADTYGAALQFCGFITLTKDGDSRTAYIGAADSTFLAEKDTVTFTEMAQYYVNAIKLIGKLEVYRLTENKFVKEAFEKAGIEMPVIDLESDSTDFGGEKAEDIYKDAEDAGAMTDKDIKDARENGTLDGTDEVPDGLLISKVRVNDELIYTLQFTTLTDGEVILLLEYVSKYYTLGERALEISIDNYAAETYVFDTSVVNAETGLYEHNLFGLHFEIAAGTHTLTIKAAVDANGDTMRAPEIHNVTVVD